MYVLAPNQSIKSFPYSEADLRRDNANTSFPRNISEELLSAWNVFPVFSQPTPSYDPVNENCKIVDPLFDGDQWFQTWEVTQASVTEIFERTSAKETEVRQQRNQLLSNCDWTQLPDAPVSPAPWATYRQELRDVTGQSGFPWEVVWPEAP